MTTFNYRVIRFDLDGEVEYRVYETHYDNEGNVAGTVESPSAVGNNLDDLRSELEHMLAALDKPVLENEDLVEIWKKNKASKREKAKRPPSKKEQEILDRDRLLTIIYPNKRWQFNDEEKNKVDMELDLLWLSLRRVFNTKVIFIWIESYNYNLNTRPMDAIALGKIQDVLDEISRVEQEAY